MQARTELERLQGEVGTRAPSLAGRDFDAQNIAVWRRMIPVLDTGEHCPTHLAARRTAH
jgi:hypothetical protein